MIYIYIYIDFIYVSARKESTNSGEVSMDLETCYKTGEDIIRHQRVCILNAQDS